MYLRRICTWLRRRTHSIEVSWVKKTCFREEPRASWLTLRAKEDVFKLCWSKMKKIILFLLRRVMWIRDKYPCGYITYIFGDFSMFRFLLFATLFFNIEIIYLLQPVLPDAWWHPKSVFFPLKIVKLYLFLGRGIKSKFFLVSTVLYFFFFWISKYAYILKSYC